MADEEIGLRATLKDRRETLAGLEQIERGVGDVGREAEIAGRRAGSGARGFERAGRAGRVMVRGLAVGAAALTGASYVAFRFSQDAVSKASDLSETINKSNVIFGRNAAAMRKWARSADTDLGLAKNAALGTAATFGDMFSQIGFTSDASARMSRDVVQMAADFGSFNNLETEDVLDRISASFRGEFDSLQAIIPNINAARVQQEALNRTGKESVDQLTAQDKALATLAILHKDGARAMGDFERTSDGLANTQKIVNAQYENATAKLGRELLPLQLEFTRWLSREGIPTLDRFATWFRDEGVPAIGDFADDMRPLAEEVIPAAGSALGTVRDALKDAAPYAKDLVGFFNDMPDWAKKGAVLGGAGLLLGRKLRSGNPSGGLTGIVSKASPVPVYVVNGLPGVDGTRSPKTKGPKAVPLISGPAAVLTGATIVSAIGTTGVMKLFDRWAPESPLRGSPSLGGNATPPGTTLDDITSSDPLGLNRIFGGDDEDTPRNPWGVQKAIQTLSGTIRDLIDDADGGRNASEQLFRELTGLDRQFTPEIRLEGTETASRQLTRLQREANSILTTVSGLVGFGNPVSPNRPPRRAHGGRVRAGQTVLVGEHRAELFKPEVNGTILPRVPDPETLDDDLGVQPPTPIQLRIDIDGQQIKDVVVRRISTEMARQ